LPSFGEQSFDELQLCLRLLVEVVIDFVDLGLFLLGDPSHDVVLEEPLLLLLEDPAIVLLLLAGPMLDFKQFVSGKNKQICSSTFCSNILKLKLVPDIFEILLLSFVYQMF